MRLRGGPVRARPARRTVLGLVKYRLRRVCGGNVLCARLFDRDLLHVRLVRREPGRRHAMLDHVEHGVRLRRRLRADRHEPEPHVLAVRGRNVRGRRRCDLHSVRAWVNVELAGRFDLHSVLGAVFSRLRPGLRYSPLHGD